VKGYADTVITKTVNGQVAGADDDISNSVKGHADTVITKTVNGNAPGGDTIMKSLETDDKSNTSLESEDNELECGSIEMSQLLMVPHKNATISTSILDIESTPSLLVPIFNVGNRCYAIAVFQLLQRMPELWSELVSILEIESRDFDTVCSKQPLTMATVMLGGELKEQFILAATRLVKPSFIEFLTLDLCRIKTMTAFHISGQEDA
jgi:hypothetical protein